VSRSHGYLAVAAAAAVLLCVGPAPPVASQGAAFEPIDLGTLGGPNAAAFAINARGQVVGEADLGSGDTHAFRWTDLNGNGQADPGEMIDLGTLGGTFSAALGVNSAGQVVGESTTRNGQTHAFIWTDRNRNGRSDPGEMVDLPPLRGGNFAAAFAINDRGRVVGESNHPAPPVQAGGGKAPSGFDAVVWEGGRLRSDIGYGVALGVNSSGQVVGELDRLNRTVSPPRFDFFFPFLWPGGANLTLDLGPDFIRSKSWASGINDRGQVSGTGAPAADSTARLAYFLNRGTAAFGLGTLGGRSSFSNGINNGGQVVGDSFLPGDVDFHGFFWEDVNRNGASDDGEMIDLDAPLGGIDSQAFGINDSSSVAGVTYLEDGTFRAILWRRMP
jgi:probable HAF family extracellular repeat protein